MIIVVQKIKSNNMQFDNSMSQKRFWFLIILLFLMTPVFGQKVRSESGNINSNKYSGYSIIIADQQEKVTDFWLVKLKEIGKLRRKRDFHQMEEFKLPDEYHPEAIYYTRVIERDSISSKIWIALDPETLLAGDSGQENVDLALENYVSSLEVGYEEYLIELQIADAERAITFTGRQQQRLIQQGKNLEYQLAESKAEKERLLETLEALELEVLALKQRIEDNEAAVEQTHVDLEKINKMIDRYREKLDKLEN